MICTMKLRSIMMARCLQENEWASFRGEAQQGLHSPISGSVLALPLVQVLSGSLQCCFGLPWISKSMPLPWVRNKLETSPSEKLSTSTCWDPWRSNIHTMPCVCKSFVVGRHDVDRLVLNSLNEMGYNRQHLLRHSFFPIAVLVQILFHWKQPSPDVSRDNRPYFLSTTTQMVGVAVFKTDV